MNEEHLNQRLQKLESDIKELKAKKKDGWDKLQILLTVLIPAAITLVGILISDSVKDSELEVAKIKAKVSQAGVIHDFLDPLTDKKNEEKQKLASQAIVLALDEKGRKILEEFVKIQPKQTPVTVVAKEVLATSPRLNGQKCESKKDCYSGYCYPGPDITKSNFCLAAQVNCAFPGADGYRYGDIVPIQGDKFQCYRPSSGLARWKKL